jgi:ABC-type glycerol-3-phosphate transport system permease component
MFCTGTLTLLGLIVLLVAFPYGAIVAELRRLFRAPRASGTRTRAADETLDDATVSARRTLVRMGPLARPWESVKDLWLRGSKHAVVWGVLLCALLPVYLMAIVSLKTNTQFYEAPVSVTPPYHVENWARAWEVVAPSVANSLFLSISSTALTLVFALAGAYFFARVRLPFSGLFWNALLVLMMMPTIANLIPLFRLLSDLNLVNTLSALILVGAAAGQVFAIFVLRNFVADIPQDLFEAAEIDGASHLQQLKTIVLPLSGTILGTVGVMLFVQQWNDFVLPLIVMRDEIRYPVMVQLQRLNGSYVKEVGPLMAGFAFASIPVIVLFIFSMRLFIKGMTEGAVKG